MTYVDGFVLKVKKDRLDEYKKLATLGSKVWKKHGALSYKECVGEDMEDQGFCKTFPQAFNVKDDEVTVFAYIEYKSRAHRDEVNEKVRADPEMSESCDMNDMPFDHKSMAFGGFDVIVES